MRKLTAVVATLLLVGACHRDDPYAGNATAANEAETEIPTVTDQVDAKRARFEDYAANSATPPEETAVTDSWIGRWNGAEGLFLEIRPRNQMGTGQYSVVVKDTLDAQAMVPAQGHRETIRFVRHGVHLSARAGTGKETGFKWLAEKQDCLIVIAGKEGYCRD